MPAYYHLIAILVIALHSCTDTQIRVDRTQPQQVSKTMPKTIREIPLPKDFSYCHNTDTAYANWLLDLSLKQNNTVYLYNGGLKADQNVQYCVLDIDIGKKDLVQCADAVMKLRADFLFGKHLYANLSFTSTSGDSLSFEKWLTGVRWKEKASRLITYRVRTGAANDLDAYTAFMEFVFSYCGSYSLSHQLKPVREIDSIQPGDVFVEGGFPGHAVTVMAIAGNAKGEKAFLLSQGYMPAQDIHILKNYRDPALSPWYRLRDIYPLCTPQWQFPNGTLKRW